MSLEDPFFVVKDEVLKALLKTRALYDRWRSSEDDTNRLRSSVEEREWAATELRNALRSIEWDLEDLDDTVQIVEKNPAKFRIDPTELAVRKHFIAETRGEVNRMKSMTHRDDETLKSPTFGGDHDDDDEPLMDQVSLTSPSSALGSKVPSASHPSHNAASSSSTGLMGQNKYSRLPNESDSPSKRSIGAVLQQQQTLVKQQDDQLNIMSDSVSNIRNMSNHIGVELDEQAVMLDEFGTEIENAESKLDATMRKMAKVLNMSNDRRQWMAIGVLSSAMLILFIMIFAL